MRSTPLADAPRRTSATERHPGFEAFAKFATADLGYMLEIERSETKVAGADESSPVALRVASVFRRENGGWKLLHRHADPITAPRSGESVIQQLARTRSTAHAVGDMRRLRGVDHVDRLQPGILDALK
jgi:hypothetical protein